MENIDIDKEILKNINIDKISKWLEFGMFIEKGYPNRKTIQAFGGWFSAGFVVTSYHIFG